MMRRIGHRRMLLNYAVAFSSVAGMIVLRQLLSPILGGAAPLILFIIPVVVTAWFGGFGPGIVATLLGGILGLQLFGQQPPPRPDKYGPMTTWVMREVPFMFVGLFISQFAAQIGKANERADERAKEAREAAIAAQRSEDFVRRVMASSPDSIHVFDLRGRLEHVNEAAAKSRGSVDEDLPLVGRMWIDWWSPADREVAASAIHTAVAGQTGSFRASTLSGDGVCHWWDVLVVPIVSLDGGANQLLSVARDVTRDREIEAELTANREQISDERERMLLSEREARQIAESASRTKDEFLAIVSHELRTPLSSILGWSDLLQHPGIDAEQMKEGLSVVHRNATAQSRIIDDILDVSRITSGKVRLNSSVVRLRDTLEAAINTVSPSAAVKHVRIVADIGDEVVVNGDPDRLQQVFWNLLANAIKFTDAEGVITARQSTRGDRAVVEISDTGKGIEPEFIPYVFDRFRQADMSTTRRSGGLGLGLAIVRHLVELHGGAVAVSSDGPGKGSTFTVELPMRAVVVAKPADSAGGEASSFSASRPGLAGVRILSLDDDPDARRLIEAALTSCSATVTTASTASEAIRMLATPGHGFDAVISDIGMPDEDGYSFIRKLRLMEQESSAQRMPAAALSAYTRDIDRAASLEAGFDLHLPKPVKPAELSAAVAQMVRRAV